MRYRIAHKREAGFSATELLVSIAIGGVLLAAITMSFISQSRSYNAQEKVNEMQQTARAVMDIMTREIRMAGYDPTENGFSGITECTANAIRVFADLHGASTTDPPDGATNGADEDIRYSYASKEIQRDGQTVAGDILSFSFDCLDANRVTTLDSDGNSTGNEASVRLIKIDITAETSVIDPSYSPTGGKRRYTLTSVVKPRNLQ